MSSPLRLTRQGETIRAAAWAANQTHEERMFGQLFLVARATLAAQWRALWQAHE